MVVQKEAEGISNRKDTQRDTMHRRKCEVMIERMATSCETKDDTKEDTSRDRLS